ncbi:hypothetical protein L6164_001445 [Bauhinia variegata]|uniref:Uncharacterized protein n=1 Tax=Bauhinia variegata TaxID=167791 RepID=A0ACB9Q9J4_BAUVA|nr:hypothetical protein L6164_001445 [Bauhinia variegata]
MKHSKLKCIMTIILFKCGYNRGLQVCLRVWRKKQSGVLRFLQRVRCWECRQQPSTVRLTRPTRPGKARRLGYKAKQVK